MKNLQDIRTAENPGFLEGLAHEFGVTANAKYVFAEPIVSNGLTLVPVGKANYGLGGGGGNKEGDKGFGGGGGAAVTPVGYIEIKDGETKFRQIVDLAGVAQLIAAGSLALFTVLWGISKLMPRSKEN